MMPAIQEIKVIKSRRGSVKISSVVRKLEVKDRSAHRDIRKVDRGMVLLFNSASGY